MATQAGIGSKGVFTTSTAKPLISEKSFEYAFILALTWIIAGSYADAWAHGHIARLETFFTPWHGILYSGYVVSACVMLGTVFINHSRGAKWLAAIPKGYELSVLGVIGFFFGGIGDMLWHTLFGIEKSIDALFSPTHIFLMICFGLMVIGPYRARYRRREQPATLKEHFLLAVAFALFLVSVTNFSQSTSPFLTFWPQISSTGIVAAQSTHAGVQTIGSLNDITQLQAIEGYLLEVVLFTGMTLYTIRSFRLTFGFFTFVQLAIAIPVSFLGDHYVVILIGLVAGLLLDAAYYFIRPALAQPWRFRLFAGISASTLYLVYMLALLMLGGIVWTVHMTVGTIFVTGLVGWLLSYLVLPAQLPEAVEQKG